MMTPIRQCPHRSPLAVADAIKDIIKGKIVCDVGCGEGDTMVSFQRYAKKVIGFEFNKNRYQAAIDRGLEVTIGDYEKDDLPFADVYYFWPDDGNKYNEFLVNKIKSKPHFNGTIIVAGDRGFQQEIPSVERCAALGRSIEVPFNEGDGPRQSGTFLLAIIPCIGTETVITILSAPRTGSSCLSACLNICGASLGATPTTKRDVYNIKGYYENLALMNYNMGVLKHCDLSIYQPHEKVDYKQDYYNQLVQIFQAEFGEFKTVVMKDPRIMMLWDIYNRLYDNYKINKKFVLLRRNHDASAQSIHRMSRKTVDVDEGVKVCVEYEKLAKVIAPDGLLEVTFEELTKRPDNVFPSLCAALGLQCGPDKLEQIQDHINHGLIHY